LSCKAASRTYAFLGRNLERANAFGRAFFLEELVGQGHPVEEGQGMVWYECMSTFACLPAVVVVVHIHDISAFTREREYHIEIWSVMSSFLV